MGKQKRKWRKNYSSVSSSPRNPNQLDGTPFVKKQQRYLPPYSKNPHFPNLDKLPEEIYEIICNGDFKGSRCQTVTDILLHRMSSTRPIVPLGIIKNYSISIGYVKPAEYKGDLTVEKNFGIALTPWHRTHYIVTLRGMKDVPTILLTRESNDLLGWAANFTSVGTRELNYPALLYDLKKIESLFDIGCIIKPYQPSTSYRKIQTV